MIRRLKAEQPNDLIVALNQLTNITIMLANCISGFKIINKLNQDLFVHSTYFSNKSFLCGKHNNHEEIGGIFEKFLIIRTNEQTIQIPLHPHCPANQNVQLIAHHFTDVI